MKVQYLYRTGFGKGHIAHFAGCHYLRRTPNAVQALQLSPSELYADSCAFCQYCLPVSVIYRKERKALTKFAPIHHLTMTMERGTLHITNGYSSWLLVPSNHQGRICLYHKNTRKESKDTSLIKGYHLQRDSMKSIRSILYYIESHDKYRKAEDQKQLAEKKEKKQQKQVAASAANSYYKHLGRKKRRLPHYTPKPKQVIAADTSDWEAFKALFKPCALD